MDFPRDEPLTLMRSFGRCRMIRNYVRIYLSMVLWPGRLKNFLLRRTGARVHPSAFIAPFVYIDPLHPELVTIAKGVFIGVGVRLFTHVIEPSSPVTNTFRTAPVTLEEQSFIGGYSTIWPRVTVGKSALVGANSLVKDNVAEGMLVYGIPPKPYRHLFEQTPATRNDTGSPTDNLLCPKKG